jgi:hypothetical protein
MSKGILLVTVGALALTVFATAMTVPAETAVAPTSKGKHALMDDLVGPDALAREAVPKSRMVQYHVCYPKPCPTSEPKIKLKKKESGTTKFQGGANARLLKQ